jgi:hypothetical protein
MTSLTNPIREEISDALILHRFKDEAKILHRAYADFAHKVYCDKYDEDTRAQIDGLPTGWLETRPMIYVRFGVAAHRLYFGGVHMQVQPRKLTEFPYVQMRVKHCDVSWFCEYGARHELADEHAALEGRKDDFVASVRRARSSIQQALKVTTIEKLIKEWPEVQPFAQRYIGSPTAPRLPMIPVDELNAALGLPAQDAAA